MAKQVPYFKKTAEEKQQFIKDNDIKPFKDIYLWIFVLPIVGILFIIGGIVGLASTSAVMGGVLFGVGLFYEAIIIGMQYFGKFGFWIHQSTKNATASAQEVQKGIIETAKAEAKQISNSVSDDDF